MNTQQTEWPAYLWLVRHGESAGNVARDKAHAAALERIDISERDVDVPLSARGEEQAAALGDWDFQVRAVAWRTTTRISVSETLIRTSA